MSNQTAPRLKAPLLSAHAFFVLPSDQGWECVATFTNPAHIGIETQE